MKKVLVTGCFDILHPAHLAFLREARKQGDFLIVALETDQRVRQLKGKDRPVNSWQKRIANLAQLKIVDQILLLPGEFKQAKAHQKFLEKIKPQILALSANTPHLKIKQKMADNLGIKIFVFPFNPQYSTSKVLEAKQDRRIPR